MLWQQLLTTIHANEAVSEYEFEKQGKKEIQDTKRKRDCRRLMVDIDRLCGILQQYIMKDTKKRKFFTHRTIKSHENIQPS